MSRLVLAIAVAAILGLASSASLSSPRIVTRALAPIDQQGKFLAEWTANLDTQMISFNLIVEATGFIGFGFSPNGLMAGADIVIGGVYDDDGRSYFSDRQGIGHTEPLIDIKQDYELTQVVQNATHTQLSFQRSLDTGEVAQDLVIRDETTYIIWAHAGTDVVEYHRADRGEYMVNLLRP